MSEITTVELVKALRYCTSPEARTRCAYHECEEECENEVRRDAADRIAQLNDFLNSQCARLLARNGELERELAAAKEDITSIVKQGVEDFEKRAWTPPCRFCVKFEECDFIPTDGEKVYLDENGYTHGDAYCSGCGEHLDGSDEFAMPGRWCPKCGADMRGEKKSD